MAGKRFDLKDSLKISVRGIAKYSANIFRILTFGSFGPGALLGFNFLNLFATDFFVITGKVSISPYDSHLSSTTGKSLVKLAKKELI
jgi:hypothetical protein